MTLLGFVVRRVGSKVIAVVGASLLAFFLVHLVPGDPVDNLAGGDAPPEIRAEIESCMNLDRPLATQLALFWRDVGNGTLGRQCPDPKHDRPPVMSEIAAAFPYTVELALGGILVALFLALPLGIVAAVRRGTFIDAAASVVSLAGISMPVMWLGPLLISLFYLQLAWLPGPAEPDAPLAIVLPSIVVGTHLMAMLARMTRSSLLDVLGEDYMRTARAKGLGRAATVLRHGLRNALLPVITVVGLQFGSLLAGAVITENIFARPGLGRLMYLAIRERNYPVIQGTVLVVAVLTVTVNLIVDLSYGVADPRIRRA